MVENSHNVVNMRKMRRKRYFLGIIIMSCALLVGIFSGYKEANKSEQNEQSEEETIHFINSNTTTHLGSGYLFTPNWDELCTQEALSHSQGFKECEKICEDFSCCLHPEGSIERCFKHKADICHKVNELCAQIVGIEESLKHKVPLPPYTIVRDCAISSINTESGREKCENVCFPGACCNASSESGINCNKDHNLEVCESYSKCNNLLDGFDPDLVNEECGKAETSVESFNECSEMCQTYMCCFRGNTHLHCPHRKDECEQYSSCKIIVHILDGGLIPEH